MDNLWSVRRQEMLPAIAKTYKGHLAILGSGACVWDDLSKVPGFNTETWRQPFDLMAVNDVGMHIPYKIEHWYSNDPWLSFWIKARRPYFPGQEGNRGGRNESIKYHSWERQDVPGINVWGWPGGGTSSLNAVFTGLALGYEKIWLCGVPLDNGPHYFDAPWIKSNFDNTCERREWENARDRYFYGKVESLSGNTKAIIGSGR